MNTNRGYEKTGGQGQLEHTARQIGERESEAAGHFFGAFAAILLMVTFGLMWKPWSWIFIKNSGKAKLSFWDLFLGVVALVAAPFTWAFALPILMVTVGRFIYFFLSWIPWSHLGLDTFFLYTFTGAGFWTATATQNQYWNPRLNVALYLYIGFAITSLVYFFVRRSQSKQVSPEDEFGVSAFAYGCFVPLAIGVLAALVKLPFIPFLGIVGGVGLIVAFINSMPEESGTVSAPAEATIAGVPHNPAIPHEEPAQVSNNTSSALSSDVLLMHLTKNIVHDQAQAIIEKRGLTRLQLLTAADKAFESDPEWRTYLQRASDTQKDDIGSIFGRYLAELEQRGTTGDESAQDRFQSHRLIAMTTSESKPTN